MISICAVNYYADEFRDILIDSVKKNTLGEYEILIHDNSNENNIGHGKAMDKLISEAKGEFILALDIDSHILLKNWDSKVLSMYLSGSGLGQDKQYHPNKLKLIGCEGGLLKPIRPCGMFFEKKFFIDNKMSFEAKSFEGVNFDVGIHFYFKALSSGHGVDFFRWNKTRYKEVWGEDYYFNNEPFIFHHWYGTRWYNKFGKQVHNEIDGRKWEDFVVSKNNLIKQYYG